MELRCVGSVDCQMLTHALDRRSNVINMSSCRKILTVFSLRNALLPTRVTACAAILVTLCLFSSIQSSSVVHVDRESLMRTANREEPAIHNNNGRFVITFRCVGFSPNDGCREWVIILEFPLVVYPTSHWAGRVCA